MNREEILEFFKDFSRTWTFVSVLFILPSLAAGGAEYSDIVIQLGSLTLITGLVSFKFRRQEMQALFRDVGPVGFILIAGFPMVVYFYSSFGFGMAEILEQPNYSGLYQDANATELREAVATNSLAFLGMIPSAMFWGWILISLGYFKIRSLQNRIEELEEKDKE